MFTAQYANPSVWFCPLGNTPAVSLTRDQPKCSDGEAKKNILLLGCGDVRNILFTCHVDGRTLDITCCDRDEAVLARNILLLTLLMEDGIGRRGSLHWKLYYHLYISEQNLATLQAHAVKLCQNSTALEVWNRSPHGRAIRFADLATLWEVRRYWMLYAQIDMPSSPAQFESDLDLWLQKSANLHESRVGCTGGLRSLYPAGMEHAGAVGALKSDFWGRGPSRQSVYREAGVDVRPNPMFASLDAAAQLHHRTDPLDGFHLALDRLPVNGHVVFDAPGFDPLLETARAEFFSWGRTFRQCVGRGLVLRFFSGEALALCHTLQHIRACPGSRGAGLYRDRNTFQPLVLAESETLGDDDMVPGVAVPLTFTVVDTSSLLDHVEALNLLTAAAPLLTNEASACLYTDSLSTADWNWAPGSKADGLLAGDLTTVALLAGLVVCDYCSNTSSSAAGHEAGIDYSGDNPGAMIEYGREQRLCVTWRRALTPGHGYGNDEAVFEKLYVPTEGLVAILTSMMRRLFGHEMPASALQGMADRDQAVSSPSLCHRGSIAAFMSLVKSRVTTDMDVVATRLLAEIKADPGMPYSSQYLEEFILHLHLQGIFSEARLLNPPRPFVQMPRPFQTPRSSPMSRSSQIPRSLQIPRPYQMPRSPRKSKSSPQKAQSPPGMHSWTNVPSVVCITLEVPKSSLGPILPGTGPGAVSGTPFLECCVQSAEFGTHIFTALQLGFGTLTTTGQRWTASFRIQVHDDKSGWSGPSPVLVSFLAPAWLLLPSYPRAEVACSLRVKSSRGMVRLVQALGADLVLFSASVSDSRRVSVSTKLPGQSEHPRTVGFAADDFPSVAVEQCLRATVDYASGSSARIMRLGRRIDVATPGIMYRLKIHERIRQTPVSPSTLLMQVGSGSAPLAASFPLPVARSRCHVSVDRQDGTMIIVTGDTATGPAWTNAGGTPFPLMWSCHTGPVLRNLTYLDLDRCPEIVPDQDPVLYGQQLGWLPNHLEMQLSLAEKKTSREAKRIGGGVEGCPPAQLARLSLKSTVHAMLLQASGWTGTHHDVFVLSCGKAQRPVIIVFPVRLRLDLGSRGVVLDALVMPVGETLVQRHGDLLDRWVQAGGRLFDVGEEEMFLWRETLPAWTERCRVWEHGDGCEFLGSRLPLPLNESSRFLCGCGKGADLPSHRGPWSPVANFCVRAAISPIFPCPLIEDVETRGM